ncbi:LysR family transcriptional regulator [Micrococcales bacterium 31B]|nr:LysR family transcriptional regulator [Micrococcales bacterium 31B]
MDTRQVEMFLAVAEHGSVTAAAASLHLTQPSLSQGIRLLERHLGGELFVRTPRGVTLTPAGRALLGPAREVRRDLRLARESVRAALGLEGGDLTIMAMPALAMYPLAPLIAAYRARYPAVRLRILDPERITDPAVRVHDGTCDLGIMEEPPEVRGLAHHGLAPQSIVLVLPPGSPGHGRPVTWVELSAYEFVTAGVGRSLSRFHLDRIFRETGAELRICVETDHRAAVADLVVAGVGAALLRAPIADALRLRGVVVRPLSPAVVQPITVIYREGKVSQAVTAFLDLASRYTPPHMEKESHDEA